MNYSITLSQEQINIVIDKYQEFEIFTTNNYTLFRAKIKYSTLSIYTTGKMLIQGNDACVLYQDICDLLNIEVERKYIEASVDKANSDDDIEIYKANIGNDEVGTGDFFGPIVVCTSCVTEDTYLKVKRLGVKDSKALTDEKMLNIAPELIKMLPHTVTILSNEKYNELISHDNVNMNRIKAILHNNVINKFFAKYPEYDGTELILDDFCGKEKYFEYLSNSKQVFKNITFVTKAENKYLSVACSSIIARYYFLKEMDKLSSLSGFELLKGASTQVDQLASEIIKTKGTSLLRNIAKLNFKNYGKANRILDNLKKQK